MKTVQDKPFIRRVSRLMSILGDVNKTANLLRSAFRIRSQYSHSGPGWKEKYVTHVEGPENQDRMLQEFFEYDFRWRLARYVVTYLRISIVARIIAGYDDKQFIQALESETGKQELRTRLSGMKRAIDADPYAQISRRFGPITYS